MKKLLATILALVMALGLCSVSWAAGTEKIVVHGIKYNNKDDNEFATLEAAYAALKPVVASVCDTSGGTDGLGQESAKSAEAFKSVFTDVDSKGNATITYKISGNVFLICSLEIPLLLLGKISGRLLPGSSVHSLMQENLLLSAIDVLFYIRPAYFSASFFLSGND